MIEKIYSYNENNKYLKLNILDKLAIGLGIFDVCFSLLVLILSLIAGDGEYYYVIPVFLAFAVAPVALFLVGSQKRYLHLLDTWVVTSNGEVYFIEPTDMSLKNEFRDINYLNRLIQVSNNADYVYYYKVEQVIAIEDYKDYVNVKFIGKENFDNKSVNKDIYVMKSMLNFNELMEDLKRYKTNGV